MAWRSARARRAVAVSLVVALAVLLALPTLGQWTGPLLAVVALTVGAGTNGARRAAAAVLLAVALTAAGVLLGIVDGRQAAHDALFEATRAGLPWLAGLAWRARRDVRRQAVERVAQARRERRQAAELLRDAERIALAESLHDDLGHALSLVALNLGRLELEPGLAPSTQEAIAAARREVSVAVGRLGSSVASLRSGAAPGLPPQDDLAGLIDRARSAGVEVRVDGMPPPDRVGRFQVESLNRLLQEALTNAVKHAPGTVVRIGLTDTGDRLRVVVRNDHAPEREPARGSGTGLAALERHLESIGGRLEVHDDVDEFSLVATLPAVLPEAVVAAEGDGFAEPEEERREAEVLTRAGRRGRLITAATVVAAIGVLAGVEAVTAMEARRALLPTANIAQIDVGDSREAVAHLLPDHELSPPPARGQGSDCHDYALTADLFDDASGDVFRLCFTGDVVTFAERVAPGDP